MCVCVCVCVCVWTDILHIEQSGAGAIYSTGEEQELMFMYQNIPSMLPFCYHNFEPVRRLS